MGRYQKRLIQHCQECQRGEPGVACLKDREGSNGVCPIKDKFPRLNPFTEQVVQIYLRALGSAKDVQGEKKTLAYLKPTEVESLLRMNEIPKEDWPHMVDMIMYLQDAHNHIRPNRPAKTKSRNRYGRSHI